MHVYIAETIEFRTIFDRPSDAFAFTWQASDGVRGAVWGRPTGPAHRSWTLDSSIQDTDIVMALGFFAGVSGGLSTQIPFRLLGLENTRIRLHFRETGEEEVGGVLCAMLAANDGERLIVLWIGETDKAIHKIFTRDRIDPPTIALDPAISDETRRQLERSSPFVSEETIELAPVFDRTIDPERFVIREPPQPTQP